jgi:hypothetical protein
LHCPAIALEREKSWKTSKMAGSPLCCQAVRATLKEYLELIATGVWNDNEVTYECEINFSHRRGRLGKSPVVSCGSVRGHRETDRTKTWCANPSVNSTTNLNPIKESYAQEISLLHRYF